MENIHNISITIADMLIELISPLTAAELGIEDRLGEFFGIPDIPVTRITLHWEESNIRPVPRGELIYNPGSIWKMYREGDNFYATLAYGDNGYATHSQCILHANPTWDSLTLTEYRSKSNWQSLLNIGAGELILRTSILFTGGLVLHSSFIIDNGQGIAFVGHSGEGKSTQADLWNKEPGVVLVNHDRNCVRMDSNAGATCYGTPWGGTAEIARNHAAPLKALIVLEKATENFIERLPPAIAASFLAARVFLPYWDLQLMERALSNLNTILESVPVYRLRCRPERDVIHLVRSVL